jgi:hypothetical protein
VNWNTLSKAYHWIRGEQSPDLQFNESCRAAPGRAPKTTASAAPALGPFLSSASKINQCREFKFFPTETRAWYAGVYLTGADHASYHSDFRSRRYSGSDLFLRAFLPLYAGMERRPGDRAGAEVTSGCGLLWSLGFRSRDLRNNLLAARLSTGPRPHRTGGAPLLSHDRSPNRLRPDQLDPLSGKKNPPVRAGPRRFKTGGGLVVALF